MNYVSKRSPNQFFFCSRLLPKGMVRPKASARNMSVAVAFGNMIVFRSGENDLAPHRNAHIPCHGPGSIYALFTACFPQMSRDSDGTHPPTNRTGVSMVEFNKALKSSGLRSVWHFATLFLEDNTSRTDLSESNIDQMSMKRQEAQGAR